MDSIFHSIDEEAQQILHDERDLFNQLIVELSMFATSPSPVITPPSDPPVEGGLAHALTTLTEILCKDGSRTEPTLAELKKVPKLISRIRHLLKVYYGYQVFREPGHKNLKFCDSPEPAANSYYLSLCGFVLMSSNTHLKRLVNDVPEFLEEIFRVENPHERALYVMSLYRQHHLKRPDEKKRQETMGTLIALNCYRVSHQLNYLLAPIWIRLAQDMDSLHPDISQRALETHIQAASGLSSVLINGVSALLTILISPINHKDRIGPWLKRWMAHGGAPALLAGTLLTGKSEAFEQLFIAGLKVQPEQPSKEVNHQLLELLQYHADRVAADPEFPYDAPRAVKSVMFRLFRQFGPSIFDQSARLAFYSTIFAFLSTRLKRHPQKYSDSAQFDRLCEEYKSLSPGSRRRYNITVYEPEQLTSLPQKLGCVFERCPERLGLSRLRSKQYAKWSKEDRERMGAWGRKLKLCGRCFDAAYCSRACQKADWPRHRDHGCSRQRKRGDIEKPTKMAGSYPAPPAMQSYIALKH